MIFGYSKHCLDLAINHMKLDLLKFNFILAQFEPNYALISTVSLTEQL